MSEKQHGTPILSASRDISCVGCGYIVQLITPSVPAMAVSTVISSFSISFQLIFM